MTLRKIVGVLLMVACVFALAFAATPYPASAQDGAGEITTLELLQTTIVPIRDPADLALRLMGVTVIPPMPTVAPPEYALGDILSFWVENMVDDYQFQVNAELVAKTPHVYMFVQVGYVSNRAGYQASAERLESVILPRVHEVFGMERSPGIDGDPHLYVLNAAGVGDWVGGYFDSTSLQSRVVAEKSNEHEMFVINVDRMGPYVGTARYESVLTHELQHLVHWSADLNEDSFINEGLSELAPLLAGYGPSGWGPIFLGDPTVQLNHWPEDSNQRGVHYGAAFMFATYFYERFGEAATTALTREPANGMEGVANTLVTIGAADPLTGAPVTVEDLFGDWLAANLLMDTTLGDGRYGYAHPDMGEMPSARVTLFLQPDGNPYRGTVKQWGPNYVFIRSGTGAQEVKIVFEGDTTVSLVPADAYSGRMMWWSNRADESNTRLTRRFDLTGVDTATLNFALWTHIEDLWDYGYVMVSTDDGVTWTALETARTTTNNPHDNAYGPGYTGTTNGWVQETVDLTPYAGQDILVRFEYITDAAVTQPGMLIDDVSIPEIGYFADFESGPDEWIAEGWLLMDNVLPQRFLVQVVHPQNALAPVTRLLGGADDPAGEWTVPVGGQYGDAILVIAGLAPVTTQQTQYTLTVTPQ